MKAMQQILTKLTNKIIAFLSQINKNHSCCLLLVLKTSIWTKS